MRKIIVDKSNKKVVNFIKSKFASVPESAIYKALRQKDIRINNVKISENVDLNIGDELTVYIVDEILLGGNSSLKKEAIIYEDDNIIIVNKPQGMLAVGASDDPGLDNLVNNYLSTKKAYPCHRLDRNTSGLMIFAKDRESEKVMLDLIKNRMIKKLYKCLVYGIPKVKEATLKAFLFKDSKSNLVIISDEKKKGYVEIITKYKVLKSFKDNTSLLEVELVTGRTHQIRAHLAHIGYPIIGDGKYGMNQINKKFNKKMQELQSYKICFEDSYGKLEYLKGKEVEI